MGWGGGAARQSVLRVVRGHGACTVQDSELRCRLVCDVTMAAAMWGRSYARR
jgi:hypothetical protein